MAFLHLVTFFGPVLKTGIVQGEGIMSRKIHIFDTTLRDGEQVPGAKLNKRQKIEIAQQLAMLNVDVIEGGSPAPPPETSKR